MSARSKRLASYLESTLAVPLQLTERFCRCGFRVTEQDYWFCPVCGRKLRVHVKRYRDDLLRDLERALQFALQERIDP